MLPLAGNSCVTILVSMTRQPDMASSMGETHSVTNQPPPLADYDLFSTDPALSGAVAAEGAIWAADSLTSFGRRLGQAFSQ